MIELHSLAGAAEGFVGITILASFEPRAATGGVRARFFRQAFCGSGLEGHCDNISAGSNAATRLGMRGGCYKNRRLVIESDRGAVTGTDWGVRVLASFEPRAATGGVRARFFRQALNTS